MDGPSQQSFYPASSAPLPLAWRSLRFATFSQTLPMSICLRDHIQSPWLSASPSPPRPRTNIPSLYTLSVDHRGGRDPKASSRIIVMGPSLLETSWQSASSPSSAPRYGKIPGIWEPWKIGSPSWETTSSSGCFLSDIRHAAIMKAWRVTTDLVLSSQS